MEEFWLKNKKFLQKNWVWLALLGLVFLNSFWLLMKGMPYQHDIEFHYGRMMSLIHTIQDGDFLALIHDTYYGYGYALGIFYGNFFLYLPALFNFIGFSSLFSYKLFFFFIHIGTVFITYYASKKIISNQKLCVFLTILYTLSEYRLYDHFVRGAIGELLAFMVAPLIILGLYEIIFGNYRKWYIFTIGFVLLLLSHLITTIFMAFFCLIILLAFFRRFQKEPNRFWYLILSAIVGVLLGAFFLFPILEQYFCSHISIFTEGSILLPSKFATTFRYLLLPGSFFSCYLGIPIIFLLPIRFLFRKKEIKQEYQFLLSFSDVLFVLGIFAWIATSNLFPWKFMDSFLSFLQFPWRLLFFASLFLTFSEVINLFLLLQLGKKNLVRNLTLFMVIICCGINTLYSVQYGVRKKHYDTILENEIGKGEYLLAGTDLKQLDYAFEKIVSNHPDVDLHYQKKGTTISVSYSNNLYEDTFIELPLFHYLGYQINQDFGLTTSDNHLIRVFLEGETGKFIVSYRYTTIQKISYFISIFSFLCFLIYLFRVRLRFFLDLFTKKIYNNVRCMMK